jgi:hypothetical protein
VTASLIFEPDRTQVNALSCGENPENPGGTIARIPSNEEFENSTCVKFIAKVPQE